VPTIKAIFRTFDGAEQIKEIECNGEELPDYYKLPAIRYCKLFEDSRYSGSADSRRDHIIELLKKADLINAFKCLRGMIDIPTRVYEFSGFEKIDCKCSCHELRDCDKKIPVYYEWDHDVIDIASLNNQG
jgi:hypothetical protein